MKLVYFSNSTIPSKAANSIHVMKMCNAFSKNGHSVHLMTARVTNEIEKDVDNIFNFYGVVHTVKIRTQRNVCCTHK